MKSPKFWAARPLLVVLLMFAAAPLGAFRPDGATKPSGEGSPGCPAPLTRVGALAAEPGASMSIVRDGVTINCVAGVRRAWGLEPVTTDTVFDAASLSKPLVAYAALRLVDQGRLDLDAPMHGLHGPYTLRQLLAHSAGFDNALSRRPEASSPSGEFQYSGAGYILIGQMIEEAVGVPFEVHMNGVVLPELGMNHSSFGPSPATDRLRASPSIDGGLLLGAFCLVAGAVGLACVGLLALLLALVRGVGPKQKAQAAWAGVAIGSASGLGVLGLMLGLENLGNIAGIVAAFSMLLAVVGLTAGRRDPAKVVVAVTAALVGVGLLFIRPAVPLELRNQAFLAPAGLRTTASDYARFLVFLGEVEFGSGSSVALMEKPAVDAGVDAQWTLGLGRGRREGGALWHWGVNFPGYQALAMRWPDGTVAVVLVNGGAMSPAPSGMRYSGLEFAEIAMSEVRNGEDLGPLWRDIQ